MSSEGMAEALAQARRERVPEMALRPDSQRPDELDDVVVRDVETFRAEAMNATTWWMQCHFHGGEHVTFAVTIAAKPKRIVVQETEMPGEWIDLDVERRAAT